MKAKYRKRAVEIGYWKRKKERERERNQAKIISICNAAVYQTKSLIIFSGTVSQIAAYRDNMISNAVHQVYFMLTSLNGDIISVLITYEGHWAQYHI